MMSQARFRLAPRCARIVGLEVSVARRRIQPSGSAGVCRERMSVVWTACDPVTPGAAAVIAAHQSARLDACEDSAWLVRVGLEPADVMRFGPRGKTPRRRRR